MTTDEAIAQLQAAKSGTPAGAKPSLIQQGFTALLTYGSQNSRKIQTMIDQLLQQSGVLSQAQQQQVTDLVAAQQKEQAQLKATRTRNALIFAGVTGAIILTTVIILKKNKAHATGN